MIHDVHWCTWPTGPTNSPRLWWNQPTKSRQMMGPRLFLMSGPLFLSVPPKKNTKIYQAAHICVYHFLIPQLFIQTFLADPAPFNKPWILLGEGTPTLPTPPSTKKTRYSHSQSLAEVKRCFCRGFCARLEELIEKTKKTHSIWGGWPTCRLVAPICPANLQGGPLW